jgi:GAF domain-containing protein/serine phosphatase RsbU (regulator of sigma subunit)
MVGTGEFDSGHPAADPTLAAECAALFDPSRLRALERSGLSTRSDARMDEFAEWARESLGVPVALVSLVRAGDQVFPGMAGLGEPWASRRSTPLSHSFCQHVVRTAAPLVITDARDHPWVRDNLAVSDLGVVAYAGMPLTDDDGHVLGSLCAIDEKPRQWTDAEVATLRRIAQACSTDLRLRLARHDAGIEEIRRDAVELARQRSFDRTQTLLVASQAFSDTATADDVVARIRDITRTELGPTIVVTVLVDGRRLRRTDDLDGALPDTFGRDAPTPAAAAIRAGRVLHHPDRASFDAEYPSAEQQVLRRLGLHTCVAAPLPGPVGAVGAVFLGWDRPRAVEPADLLTLASIAGYAGQALHRADVLGHRIAVAHEMQNAMLTTLPFVVGLEMVARYEPADRREHVGGDWFDAALLRNPVLNSPRLNNPGLSDPGLLNADVRDLIVSVGDVIGHTVEAATIMGQVRSMLRQAAWDRPGSPPSAIMQAFESANDGLDLGAKGTAVLARLHGDPTGPWSLTWTNAGHPPPVLLGPDGDAELLAEHDALFGFSLTAGRPRRDHHRVIRPGSTLFLYTDGLVEHRGSDLDAGTEELIAFLKDARHRPVGETVATVIETLAPDSTDDVVAFAIRFPDR